MKLIKSEKEFNFEYVDELCDRAIEDMNGDEDAMFFNSHLNGNGFVVKGKYIDKFDESGNSDDPDKLWQDICKSLAMEKLGRMTKGIERKNYQLVVDWVDSVTSSKKGIKSSRKPIKSANYNGFNLEARRSYGKGNGYFTTYPVWDTDLDTSIGAIEYHYAVENPYYVAWVYNDLSANTTGRTKDFDTEEECLEWIGEELASGTTARDKLLKYWEEIGYDYKSKNLNNSRRPVKSEFIEPGLEEHDEIANLEDVIMDYTNLRNRYLTDSDVEGYSDNEITAGDASDVISGVHHRLNLLNDYLNVLLADIEDGNFDDWEDDKKNVLDRLHAAEEFAKEWLTENTQNELNNDIFQKVRKIVGDNSVTSSRRPVESRRRQEVSNKDFINKLKSMKSKGWSTSVVGYYENDLDTDEQRLYVSGGEYTFTNNDNERQKLSRQIMALNGGEGIGYMKGNFEDVINSSRRPVKSSYIVGKQINNSIMLYCDDNCYHDEHDMCKPSVKIFNSKSDADKIAKRSKTCFVRQL